MKLISCILAGAFALAFAASLHAAPPAGKTPQLTSPDQVPEGLAKSDWQSIRAAYEAGRHAFAPIATGWQARKLNFKRCNPFFSNHENASENLESAKPLATV